MKQKGLAPILIVLLIAAALGGYLIYQKQPKPVSISQPSPTPVASPVASSSAETANWVTYVNNKYGFKFEYPNNATRRWVSDEMDTLTLEGPLKQREKRGMGQAINTLNISLQVKPGQDINQEAQNTINSFLKANKINGAEIKSTTIVDTLIGDNIVAKRADIIGDLDGGIKNPSHFFIKLQDKYYLDMYVTSTGEKENKMILDKILSTFKFTQ